MITLRLTSSVTASRTWIYRVADRLLVSDAEIDLLRSFAIPDQNPGVVLSSAGFTSELLDPNAPSTYRGLSEIAGRLREVECWSGPRGFRIRFEGQETFVVTRDGSFIARLSDQPSRSGAEDFLEPMLILALALQGVFCLHAGSVEMNGRAVAFLGNSGAGKSTLAAFLSRSGAGTALRLADDLLPVEATSDGVAALPDFPQRKLDGGAACGGTSSRLPLTAIYLIDPLPGVDPGDDAVRIETIRPSDAALALVRHTAGTRLLDDDALARHMGACAHMAATVAVRHLGYPRILKALPRVENAIRHDFQSHTKNAG